MNNIDIKKASLEIEKLKFPIIFLFKLVSYENEISEENMSIILRLFLKHHLTIALEINLKKILSSDPKNVLTDFYKILKKRINLLFVIKKWHKVYPKPTFWKLTHVEQLDSLANLKNIFLAIYDCSKGGIPLHFKIQSSQSNVDIKIMIIERLESILKLFGKQLFNSLDIPLITIEDIDIMNDSRHNRDIVKYLLIIYEKFNELIEQTIKIFDSYNLSFKQLYSLLNPIVINIKTIAIESETEISDFIC